MPSTNNGQYERYTQSTEFRGEMGVREVEILGRKLTIHERDDTNDPSTGRALTGSWLWESALYLAEWMASEGRAYLDLAGRTVLELGAGTGLPGLATAVLGAARVVLTDVAPLLPGLWANVEANGLEGQVEVRKLRWGEEDEGGGGRGGDVGCVL
uniref:Protein N-lysine methyltransferase METTL21A-like n=1 Tax=Elaeis guineensis var. tenera TaxID=51953 RepID=A0A8N4FAJ2_ELAGV|nr:protein N-lysine methyltransferase METTL21A-like [Elaeis guineensis]